MDSHLNIEVKDSVSIKNSKSFQNKKKDLSDHHLEEIRKVFKKNKQAQVKRQRKKSKPPLKLILYCTTLLALSVGAHFYYDDIDQLLSRIEVSVLGQSLAQTEKSAAPKQQKETNRPSDKSKTEIQKMTNKTSWTEEELNIFRGLEQRKKELDEKEKSLNQLAEELQKQKLELEAKLKNLEDVRQDISRTLGEQVEKDEEKLGKLVEVYSNMKPQSAAQVFENIDENLAVDILARMKKDKAANILNLIEPQKARRLSEKFAGYVRK